MLSQTGFSEAYALFVDCQMKLYGRTSEFQNLVTHFYKGNLDTQKVLNILLEGKKDVSKELQRHTERDKSGKVIDVVWRRKAYEFARIMAPLMRDMHEQIPESGYSRKAKSDAGFRKDITKRQLKRKGLGQPKGKGQSHHSSPPWT